MNFFLGLERFVRLSFWRRTTNAVIGRALMAKPKIILMDEPSMGLSPMLVRSF